MGFGGGGGGHSVRSDINITPLVDIVLVLLIIFIVATPMKLRELTLEIPRKAEPATEDTPDSQVVVEVAIDGTIKVGGQDVNKFDLATRVSDQLKTKRDKIVFVGFDDGVRYGDAVAIVDVVKGAGAETVALKIPDEKPADAPAAP